MHELRGDNYLKLSGLEQRPAQALALLDRRPLELGLEGRKIKASG